MSEIIKYDSNVLRSFRDKVSEMYTSLNVSILPFEDWACNAMPILQAEANAQYPMKIRLAPTEDEMLEALADNQDRFDYIQTSVAPEERELARIRLCKEIFVPRKEFTIEAPIMDPGSGAPIWFGNTLTGINLRMGYHNGDSSTPHCLTLDDENVHAMLGGTTGSGKSVSMHTLILNLMLEYSPWELALYLGDLKLVEFPKYAMPIAAPHVSVIGASGNSTLIASMFKAVSERMLKRQKIFKESGVENLKNWRKRYNLVMPRLLLIVDEFVQYKENLAKAEMLGSSTTDAEKQKIEQSLGEVARLGRSMGCHMLISSQNLNGVLSEQTEAQFSAGIALKSNAAISKTLLGNEVAKGIRGKGKCLINKSRAEGKPEENEMARIPYIDCELSDKDMEAGRQTFLTKELIGLRKLADEYGYDNDLFYYNDDTLTPYREFQSDVELAIEHFTNPKGDESEVEIFKMDNLITLTLGREVKCSNQAQAEYNIRRVRDGNILVSGACKPYIISLLANNVAGYKQAGYGIDNHIVAGDIVTLKKSKIEETLSDATVYGKKVFPESQMNKAKARKRCLDLADTIWDSTGKLWDTVEAIKFLAPKTGHSAADYGVGLERLVELAPYIDEIHETRESIDPEKIAKIYEDITLQSSAKNALFSLVELVDKDYTNIRLTTGFEHRMTARDFKPVFVWLLGLDTFTDISNEDAWDYIGKVKQYLHESPQVNIINVMTAEIWNKLNAYALCTELIIEKEIKDFYSLVDLPSRVNIYEHTFQAHKRSTKEYSIIKEYKL